MGRVIMVLLLFVLIGHIYALDEKEMLLLEKIVLLNKTNRETLNSLEIFYDSNAKVRDAAGTERDIIKQGCFAFKGNKFYSKEKLNDGSELLFFKNGNQLTSKSTANEDAPSLIAVGTDGNSNIKPGSPGPWDKLDNGMSLKLDKLPANTWSIQSVGIIETEGESLVKVELFKLDRSPNGEEVRIPIEIHYSPKYGYLPVKMVSEFKYSEKTLYEESSISDIEVIDLYGTKVFLPCKASRKVIRDGIVSSESSYSVDKKSIKVNPDLPDSMFTVKIGPKDQVVNLDINMELQGPGGRDFLTEKFLLEGLNDNPVVEKHTPTKRENKLNKIEIAKGININLIEIPAGNFMMGSPDNEVAYSDNIVKILKGKGKALSPPNEHPQKEVAVSRFMMAETEITVEQFKLFLPSYKRDDYEGFSHNKEDYPALVTWDQASQFCDWLSHRTGYKVRLPNEREWEYACRANSTTRFFWGDNEIDAGRFANIADQAYEKRWPDRLHTLNTNDGNPWISSVAQYQPNAFGLYDMIGNIDEWCSDDYFENNEQSSTVTKDGEKIFKGGAANSDISSCRCASRHGASRGCFIGFRVIVEF